MGGITTISSSLGSRQTILSGEIHLYMGSRMDGRWDICCGTMSWSMSIASYVPITVHVAELGDMLLGVMMMGLEAMGIAKRAWDVATKQGVVAECGVIAKRGVVAKCGIVVEWGVDAMHGIVAQQGIVIVPTIDDGVTTPQRFVGVKSTDPTFAHLPNERV
jgi:hypothetical protein